MTNKKKVTMHIAGKDYKVSGAESEEQARLIEGCVNEKINALHKLFSVQGMTEEGIAMLAAINLADDYLKARKQAQLLKSKLDKLSKKERQLQEAIEKYEEEILSLEAENQDYAEKLRNAEISLEE